MRSASTNMRRPAAFDAWVAGVEGGLWRGIAGWWRRCGTLFLFLLGVSVASFGIDLFNLAISIDEEFATLNSGRLPHWIQQDRWGMYLIYGWLLPSPAVPFVSLLIGLVANALAGVVAVALWGGLGTARGFVAGAFIVSTPVLGFLMHFNTSQYGFYIGLLASVTAVTLFVHGGYARAITGALLMVFAVSVYQAVALGGLVVYLVWVLSRISQGHPEWMRPGRAMRSAALFAAWFAAALIGHKLSSVAARAWFAPDGGYALVDGVYSGAMFERYRWGAVLEQVRGLLLGRAWYMGRRAGVVAAVSALVVLGMIGRHQRSWGVRGVGVLVLAAACAAPFLLVIATGRVWPTRTMLGLPLLLGGLVFCAMGARVATIRAVVTVLALVCLAHFVIANNRLMYADQLSWARDRDLALKIQDRLAMAGMTEKRTTRLAVLGMPTPRFAPTMIREETIGGSIFAWGDGNPHRIAMLMQTLGSERLVGTRDRDDYRRALHLGESMPDWPSPGSVVLEGDLAVVRFGPATRIQSAYSQ